MKPYHVLGHRFDFDTRIKSMRELEDKVLVTLRESYFYPEGGGQPSDQGTINGKAVLLVTEEKGETVHHLASFSGFTLNMPVHCVIDADRRRDHSIQHTAQHVLSAVLQDGFAIATVAFHMGVEHTTIDTDKVVSPALAREAEARVNGWIREDLKVKAIYQTLESLKGMTLRKPTGLTENIRVVRIGELDSSACGGTHVDSLRELFLFRLLKVERYKEGSRLTFVAGDRAYRALEEGDMVLRQLREELSVGVDELPFRVRRLLEDREESVKRVDRLTRMLGAALAAGYAEDVVVEETDHETELLITLGRNLAQAGKRSLFYRRSDCKVFFFTNGTPMAGRFLKEIATGVDFRGSGGPREAQGTLKDEAHLERFVSQAYAALLALENQ